MTSVVSRTRLLVIFIATVAPDILATPTNGSLPPSKTTAPTINWESQTPRSQSSQTVEPSKLPSYSSFPSTKPPLFRFLLQNQNPTSFPSTVPSYLPSAIPSLEPSNVPSHQPTSFPSSTPTQTCHDRDDYRSPINGIPCSYHRGTDCTLWRHVLNQNMTALVELIESCPVACKIPCGTFSLQTIDLSLILSNVSGLLDFTTQTPLEEVGRDYLTEYIASNYIGNITLVLESVTLKYQERLSRRQLRGLQGMSHVRLRVILSLVGFSIGVEQGQLTQLLTAAVDSDEFTHLVQKSSVFFEHAQISSVVTDIPRSTAIDSNDETKSNSVNATSITLTVALAACALVMALAIGFLVVRNRLQTGITSSGRELDVATNSRLSRASCSANSSSHSDSSSRTPLRGIRFHANKNILGSLSHSRDSDDNISIDTKEYERGLDTNECGDCVTNAKASVDSVTVVIEGMGEVHKDAAMRSASRMLDEEESVATTPASRTSEVDITAPTRMKQWASGGDIDLVRSVVTKPVSSQPIQELHSNAKPQKSYIANPLPSPAPRSASGMLTWKMPAIVQGGPTQVPRQTLCATSVHSGNPADCYLTSARRRTGDTPPSEHNAQPSRVRRSRGQNGEKDPPHVESIISFHSQLRFVLCIPSGGPLGLTIQSGRKEEGSWIYHVWGHSPLLGLAFVGDHIVKVENIDTSKMDSRTLCELLHFCRCQKTGTTRLVVARQAEKNTVPLLLDLERGRLKQKIGKAAAFDSSVPLSSPDEE